MPDDILRRFVANAQAAQAAVDALGAGRLDRHHELLALWHGCSAEEVLTDLVIGAQVAAFKAHQEQVLSSARLAHAQGATHDCSEWLAGRICQVCGANIPGLFPD